MDISRYKSLDRQIFLLACKVGLLRRLHPTNYRQQKEKFLAGKIKEPKFIYNQRVYDTENFESTLKNLKPPDDKLGKIYKNMIQRLIIKNELIKKRGEKRSVKRLSRLLFGRPSTILVHKAKRILRVKNLNQKEKFNLKAEIIKTSIKNKLEDAGLVNWDVKVSQKYSVSLNPTLKRIEIGTFQRYSRQSIKRLLVHEVYGHLFRAENGYKQPLKLFVVGLPGYLESEEGIASFLEEKNNVSTEQSFKRFALRVIAVNLMDRGADFKQCFDEINKYEHDPDKCWEITRRVYRGGGFHKDYLYLKGYLNIKKFYKKKQKT